MREARVAQYHSLLIQRQVYTLDTILFYIRTVRGDNKDPLTQFMKEEGIPNEADITKPDSVTVFSFPMKSPSGAVTRTEMSAIEQLELWKLYALNWCEHKPSVTISVKEEWMEVGAWLYDNFDIASGVSFSVLRSHLSTSSLSGHRCR